jgi:hypothetical protein
VREQVNTICHAWTMVSRGVSQVLSGRAGRRLSRAVRDFRRRARPRRGGPRALDPRPRPARPAGVDSA